MRFFKIASFTFGVVLFCIAIIDIAPYVYLPPALPKYKLYTYTKVAKFIGSHRELGDVRLHWFRGLDMFRNNTWVDYRDYLNEQDVHRVEELRQGLKEVHCDSVQSEGGMILFYPRYSLLFPSPPGVLFSIDGNDPNIFGDRIVKQFRPYTHLHGYWYSSAEMKPKWHSPW